MYVDNNLINIVMCWDCVFRVTYAVPRGSIYRWVETEQGVLMGEFDVYAVEWTCRKCGKVRFNTVDEGSGAKTDLAEIQIFLHRTRQLSSSTPPSSSPLPGGAALCGASNDTDALLSFEDD